MRNRVALPFVLALVGSASSALAQGTEGTPIGVAPAEPAPAAPPASAQAPAAAPAAPAEAPPPYEEKAAPTPTWPERQGFTLEVGFGPAYTALGNGTGFSGGWGYGGVSVTLGGFVSPRLAIGGRVSGTTFFDKVTEHKSLLGDLNEWGAPIESKYQVVSGFAGPALQVFVSDRIFLGGGAGFALFAPLRQGLDANIVEHPPVRVGFALDARVGFGLIALRHSWLGLVLEAIPTFYDVANGVGTTALLQWQYY